MNHQIHLQPRLQHVFSRALTENLGASIEALKISLNIVDIFHVFLFLCIVLPQKPVYQLVKQYCCFPQLNMHLNIRTQVVLLVIKDININMLGCQIIHSFAMFVLLL